jgi:hypothetical protein
MPGQQLLRAVSRARVRAVQRGLGGGGVVEARIGWTWATAGESGCSACKRANRAVGRACNTCTGRLGSADNGLKEFQDVGTDGEAEDKIAGSCATACLRQ